MLGEPLSGKLLSTVHIPARWFDVLGIESLPVRVSNAHAPLPISPRVMDAAIRNTGYSQPAPALTWTQPFGQCVIAAPINTGVSASETQRAFQPMMRAAPAVSSANVPGDPA